MSIADELGLSVEQRERLRQLNARAIMAGNGVDRYKASRKLREYAKHWPVDAALDRVEVWVNVNAPQRVVTK